MGQIHENYNIKKIKIQEIKMIKEVLKEYKIAFEKNTNTKIEKRKNHIKNFQI